MLYLIGSIVFAAMIAVVMKVGKAYIRSNSLVLAINYLSCFVLSFVFILAGRDGHFSLFPSLEGLGFTIGLGIVAGLFYVAGYVLLQWNIAMNGAVLGETFIKLGVLVPTVLAITLFREQPSIIQIVGLLVAIGAILLINLEKETTVNKEKHHSSNKLGLVLLLLFGGMADGFSKVYEYYGNEALQDHFLLYLFFVAFLFCAVRALIRKEHPAWRDLLFGVLLGVPNYLTARFLLLALNSVKAVVVYPTYSVGSILLVMVFGLFLFKERLSKRQFLAIGLILFALVLLNI